MIFFPNAKINIGLRLMSIRKDGFHNIESIFFPINLFDVLEVIKAKSSQTEKIKIYYSGNTQLIPNDLCIKAYNLLDSDFNLPSVKVFLHKNIPIGSGLGGGSSNAVSMLKILNDLFKLNLNHEQLLNYCSKLGSDCSFFLFNKPSFVSGLGDVINSKINFSLKGYKLLLVFPAKFLSTSEVFENIEFKKKIIDHNNRKSDLFCKILSNDFPIELWKENLRNDLERTSFKFNPEINEIKEKLYDMGAVYASMSGSGSSVYGIFSQKKIIKNKWNEKYFSFLSDLN